MDRREGKTDEWGKKTIRHWTPLAEGSITLYFGGACLFRDRIDSGRAEPVLLHKAGDLLNVNRLRKFS